MFTKKKQIFSKKNLRIPLGDNTSRDITYCMANCSVICQRRKHPKGIPYSLADLSQSCKNYKERNSNAHTKTLSERRP